MRALIASEKKASSGARSSRQEQRDGTRLGNETIGGLAFILLMPLAIDLVLLPVTATHDLWIGETVW